MSPHVDRCPRLRPAFTGRRRAPGAAVLALILAAAVGSTGCLPPSAWQVEPSRATEPPLPRFVSAEAAAASAYLRGQLYRREGKLGLALAQFQEAVAYAPDDLPSRRAVVELAMRLGRANLALESAERARDLAPDDAAVLRDYVGVLVATQQLERAAQILEEHIATSEQAVDPSLQLGLLSVYLELDRDADAEALSRSLIERLPDEVQGYLALGAVFERRGRLDDAEDLYQRAFDSVPLDPRLYDGLARIARARGQTDREIEWLRGKLDMVPGDSATLGRLVEIYSDRQDRGELISVIEEIVYYNRGNSRARLQLGVLYLQAGRLDDAITSFDALRQGSTPSSEIGAQSRYLLGRIYTQIGELEQATGILEAIPADAKTYVEAQLALVAVHQELERYPEALQALDRALERSSSMSLRVQRAQLLQLSGRSDEGVALIESLIRDHPDQAGELYYQLGMLHTQAGRDDLALEIMLRALEIAPQNPNVMNFIGYVWADRGVRLDEAEGLIRGAVAQRPEDGFIIDSLGWVLYKRGLERQREGRLDEATQAFDGAIRELERARELVEKGDPTIEWHLGDVYQALLRYEDALEAYEAALELDPSDEDANAIRVEIERVERFLKQTGGSPGSLD